MDAAIHASNVHAADTASAPSSDQQLISDTSPTLYESSVTASNDSAQVHSSP